MSNDPEVLDEKHPLIAPTIEKLAQRKFDTPDLLEVARRIEVMHEAVTVRKDSAKPFGPFNRLSTAGLVLSAPTYYGKSYSIDKALDNLGATVTGDGQEIAPKVLRYKCAPNANVSSLLNTLLRQTGYPLNRDISAGAAASRIAPQCQEERFTLLFVDEFQWALNPAASPGRSRSHDENLVWNTLHSIIDNAEWPVPVIVSGLPSIIGSLNEDSDERAAIRSRFHPMSMQSLSIHDAADIEDIVALYCDDTGIASSFSDEFAFGKRLIHASNYTLGIVLQTARFAIARAVLRKDRLLKPNDFVDAYAVKTNCRLEANPFHSNDWRQIDPTLLVAQTVDQRRPPKPGK